MRHLFYILSFTLLSLNSPAQIHKRFYDKKNRVTQDSSKAVKYALYQLTKQDSIWSTVFLDMNNYPILKGYFLDDDLTIKQGKFDFYSTSIVQRKISDHQSSIDTEIYKTTTGYYDNNLKVGNWVDYNLKKTKMRSCYYENDIFNGRYEEYYENGCVSLTGDYINGIKVGDWYSFNADSSIAYIMRYAKNGIMYDLEKIDKSSIYYGAYPRFNFYRHIRNFLIQSGAPICHGRVLVGFTIDINGVLTKPELLIGINEKLDKLIIQALTTSPKWIPAKKDKIRVEQRLTFAFEYSTDNI